MARTSAETRRFHSNNASHLSHPAVTRGWLLGHSYECVTLALNEVDLHER